MAGDSDILCIEKTPTADGGTTYWRSYKFPFIAADGRRLLAGMSLDVTAETQAELALKQSRADLAAANAKLTVLATTDGLTGVNNRMAFNAKLTEEFGRAGRHAHPLSLVLMDVDDFKAFNDQFGHPAGDAVLKATAATLQQTVRSIDMVARYGGEEFAVILPDTDEAGAMALAERFRQAIADHPWKKRAVTVSVGAATLTPLTADADELLRDADRALYESKNAGRNRVRHGSGVVPLASATRT